MRCATGTGANEVQLKASSLRMMEADAAFATHIVNRLHNDAIGRECKQDNIILLLGSPMNKAKKGSTKSIESRKKTMKYMRQLATLSIEFKDVADRHNIQLETIDIFNRSYFDYLDLSVRGNYIIHNMKLAFGYVLKTAARSLQAYYLLAGDNDELAAKATSFLLGLKGDWEQYLEASVVHGKKTRQEVLRKPARLPNNEQLQCIKTLIMNNL